MSTAAVRGVVRQFVLDDPPTDAALVTRYARTRENAPFAELLRRHGPVVLGVCRRLLADPHAAEDAFQAVFLVLARKANGVRPPGSVGSWLYGVAVRTARKAKVAAARRWRREMASAMAEANPGRPVGGDLERTELRAIIDDELGRLSADLRAAVVLCDLGGKSRSQAARELGCPEGTIAARLHRARKLLADRLTRRGVALPAAGLGAVLSPEAVTAAVSPDLARTTLAAAELFATRTAGPAVSPAAQALAEGMIRAMSTGKFKLMLVAVLAAGLMSGAGALWGAAAGPRPEAGNVATNAPSPSEERPDNELGYVSHIEFSPDGKRYCVVAGGMVRVNDAATGRIVFTIPGEGAGFTADGKTLCVMGQKVLECDPETGKVRTEHPRPKTKWGWHRVAFSPDGKRYAAHFGMFAGVYDTATGFEPVRLAEQHEMAGGVLGATGKNLVWSPDGKQVAAVGVLVKTDLMSLAMSAAVWDAETGKQVFALAPDITDGPLAVAFTPDGSQLAVGFKDSIELLQPGPNPVKKNKMLPTGGQVTALAFSPDRKLLAVGTRLPIHNGADKEPAVVGHKTEVQLLDVETRKELKRFDGFEGVNHMAPTRLPVTALAFSPDGKKLVAGTGLPGSIPLPNDLPKTGEVKTFSLAGEPESPAAAAGPWREKAVLKDIKSPVISAAFAPDGKSFAAGGAGGEVVAYDAASLRVLWSARAKQAHPAAVAYSSDGKLLGVTVPDGVQMSEAATGMVDGLVEEKGSGPHAVAFAPERLIRKDGKESMYVQRRLIFGGGRRYFVKTWVQWPQLSTIEFGPAPGRGGGPGRLAAPLAVAPDGSRVILTRHETQDGKFVLWAWGAGTGAANHLLVGHTDTVFAAAWSADGKLVATGGADGNLILWDAATFKEARRIRAGGEVLSVALSPDGKLVAAGVTAAGGKRTREVVLWATATGKEVQRLGGFPNMGVGSLAFSPDGKTLVATSGNLYAGSPPDGAAGRGQVRVFTTEPEAAKPPAKPEPVTALDGWQEKAVLTHHAGPVDSVAFAPDGKAFVSGGADGRVLIWDAAVLRPQELGRVIPVGKYTAVAYSPDGKLVAATRDKATGFFDPEKRQTVPVKPLVPGGTAVAFAPAGGRVAVGDGTRTVIRSLPPGSGEQEVKSVIDPTEAGPFPASLAWSPDGSRLAVPYHHPIDGQYGADVYTLATGKARPLTGHSEQLTALAWSRDGKLIATAGRDGRVALWDGTTSKELRWGRIVGRDAGPTEFHSLAFSQDGKTLAAAVTLGSGKSADRILLIDTSNLDKLEDLFSPVAPVRSVAFSPDGKLLVAACGIDREKVKPLMTPDEMKAAGAVVVWERKP